MLRWIVFLWLLATAVTPAFADQIILPSALTRDRSVAVTYRMEPPRTGQGQGTLAVEWTDGDGRLIERRQFRVSLAHPATLVFPLDLQRAVVTANRLRTRLAFDDGAKAVTTAVDFAVPPAARGWPDYQIFMWQAHDAAQDRTLAQLGVTAGMVYAQKDRPSALPTETIAPLLASGLGWYVENIATDFYSAYHRWSPDHPVNWRFAEVKKLYQENPLNRAALMRDPSLSDPQWLAKIGKRLTATVRSERRYRPLFYNLADEPGIADLSVFWDFDFSPPSLAGLRQWLRGRYPGLAALNHEWGTDFATWDQVMPPTTRETMRRPGDNFAAWNDFKAWMDVAFARAVAAGAAAVHAGDPTALAAIEGAQSSGWGGYDYSRLANTVDVMEVYDDGENFEALRAFNPKLILLTTSASSGATEIHDTWRELLRGSRGLVLWDPKSQFVGADGQPGERGKAAAATFREIRDGLGALLIGSRRRTDPIALLYSPASLRLQWLLDWRPKGDGWSARDADSDYDDANPVRASMKGFLRDLEHRGLQPRFVTDRMLAAGMLERDGYRVLILPRSLALSATAAQAIRHFIAGGGTVIADGVPGVFDGHGRKLARPRLANLFKAPPGQGRAVYLSPGGGDHAEAALLSALATAGVAPAVRINAPSGAAIGDVETYRFDKDGRELLALQRDLAGTTPAATEPVILTLPRRVYVYDLRKKTFLGRHRRLALSLDPVAPTVLALSDHPSPAPVLTVPRRLRAGANAALALRLSGASPTAVTVLHLTVIDPDGRIVPHYSGNLWLRGEKAMHVLPLALNDAPGRWQIRVRDVASGQSAAASFTLLRP